MAVLHSVVGRLYLYGRVLVALILWGAKQASGLLTCRLQQHPLGWPADQDFNITLLKTLFTCGSYQHWRNFMSIWLAINGKAEQRGLTLQKVAPDTFGVPGCRNSWWITLGPALSKHAPPAKASCVLMFLHGGAFMAGDPRMYCLAFKLWMQQLAAQGISMRVLSVGYPLAPEHPYPAAILASAAAYRWLLAQLQAEGRSDTVILGGDSAGGNLVLTCLAYLRDGSLGPSSSSSAAAAAGAAQNSAGPQAPPPAAAMLISPAADFTESSVFGPALAAHFAKLAPQQQQQQQQAHGVSDGGASEPPRVPQPSSEFDYVTVAEGSAVAKHYVGATSQAEMGQPLVSPTLLPSFEGLVQQRMLVLWGAVEVMAPDIAHLAGRMRAGGVEVQTHAEPNEPHVYCVLPLEGVLERGARVIVPFLAGCVKQA